MIALPGQAALLLAFALLLAGRIHAVSRAWSWIYVAQCVAIALSAVAASVRAGDPSAAASVPVLLIQAALVQRLLRGRVWQAPNPLLATGGGLLLAALALSAPLPDGFGAALAILLLGLLAAALIAEAGLALLLALNGAASAACLLPNGWLPALVLAGTSAIVAGGGIPRLGALR